MAIQTLEELNLISRALVDQEAFAVIYERYFTKVYNYVRFRVKSAALTDELTSQVFIKVWSNLDKFQPRQGNFGAWLFKIAHNEVVDYYRREKRHHNISLSEIGDIAKENNNPEAKLIHKETYEDLLKALETLSDRERNIIGLKFCARLTNRQIAKLTMLTESHIGVILYRAMRRLETILNERGHNRER